MIAFKPFYLSLLYFTTLSFLLLKPQSDFVLVEGIFGIPADKLIHFSLFLPAFAALTVCTLKSRTYFYAILMCVIGESVHYLLPYRSFSWYDMLANLTGMHVGMMMYRLLPPNIKNLLKGDKA